LRKACEQHNIDAIMMLIKAKANVNERCYDYIPCLHLTVKYGNLDVVRTLLEQKADPNLWDSGETPLHYALYYARKRHYSMIPIIKCLIDHKADPTFKDHRGKTYLDYANQNEFKDVQEIFKNYL